MLYVVSLLFFITALRFNEKILLWILNFADNTSSLLMFCFKWPCYHLQIFYQKSKHGLKPIKQSLSKYDSKAIVLQ